MSRAAEPRTLPTCLEQQDQGCAEKRAASEQKDLSLRSKQCFTLFAQHWRQIQGKLTNLGAFASFEMGNPKQEVCSGCTTGTQKAAPAAPRVLAGSDIATMGRYL